MGDSDGVIDRDETADGDSGGIVSIGVVYLGLFLFAYTVPLAVPAKEEIAKTLSLAASEDAAPIFTAYFLAWLLIVPPGAYLADLLGRKTMLLAGSLSLTIGMILLSVSTNLPMACAAQFLNGAGAILLQIVGVAIITDLDAKRRGSNLSLAVGLVGMVALMSPMLMAELIARGVAWTTVYRFSAILPAVAFVAQWFCRFPTPAQAQKLTLEVVGQLLRSPMFLLLIFAMLVYGIIEQGIPIWSFDYFGKELGEGFSPEEKVRWQGAIVTGYFLIMSLARLIFGALGWLEGISHPRVIVVCAVLGGICLAMGTLPNNPTMAIIFLIASGPAIAMIWPAIMTYAVESTGQPTTTVFGLVVGIGGATGVILGAQVLGEIKKAGLSYQQSLLTLEVPFVLLVLIFIGAALTASSSEPATAAKPPDDASPKPAEVAAESPAL